MDTAGSVVCNVLVCRKHGAKRALDSMYCRDPKYTVPPSAPTKRAKPNTDLYSELVSSDWGIAASNVRENDMKLLSKMFRGLFADDMPGMTQLFHSGRAVFTIDEINACFGLSTMTENALDFFKGKWWQWRKDDDVRSLLDNHPPVVHGQDRLSNTEDYGPYGQPESNQGQESAGEEHLAVDERAGSSDTLPDDVECDPESKGPALGAYGFMLNAGCWNNVH